MEGILEGAIISTCLISLLLETYNKSGEVFFGMYLEVEKIVLSFSHSVIDSKLPRKLVDEGLPAGKCQIVGIKLNKGCVVVKSDLLEVQDSESNPEAVDLECEQLCLKCIKILS